VSDSIPAYQVRVLPAAAGTGRYFVRVDMHSQPIIPARVEAVRSDSFRLSWVGRDGAHLLAALAMMGVDNARIEIDEVRTAFGWIGAALGGAIASVGLVSQSVPSHGEHSGSHLQEAWVYQGDAFVAALPAPEARFTYGIDFDLQQLATSGTAGCRFLRDVKSSRTGKSPQLELWFSPQIDALHEV